MDKIGLDGVKKELKEKNIDPDDVLKIVQLSGNNQNLLKSMEKIVGKCDGLRELDEFLVYAGNFGIKDKIKVDFSLVRGLDYYTGLIFEVYLGVKVGCGGGGRYDNLISNMVGQSMPATGVSLGLDRILEVMKEKGLFVSKRYMRTIFVANVSKEVVKETIEVAQKLRNSGINVQTDLMEKTLGKQLEYANNIGIPYVLIVGKKELDSKSFKLKDMVNKTEKNMRLNDVVKLLTR